MRVFTIKNGEVCDGARVDSFTLKGAKVTIPAIIVGEEGRNRELGILPVQLPSDTYRDWKENGSVEIYHATVGSTKAGKPKLFASTADIQNNDCAIVVFRTHIGFRGGNSHTGDRKDVYFTMRDLCASDMESAGVPMQTQYTPEEVEKYSAMYLDYRFGGKMETPGGVPITPPEHMGFKCHIDFLPFPGEVLARGVIAQGTAGRMGWGDQIIATMPAGIVFRTGYSGRLYGAPKAHYYRLLNGEIVALTWQERQVVDLF